ncbi:saccharopine dehydrogenase family protein [Halomonas sp. THAF12]|uniref:saccharopine dehydrogenase family protein n=1 Tax=Halomonas sp. B23F22_10 TaxID=3459515 RepID=UPI00373E9695
MKILALGGCGDMGRVAVREIIGNPTVSEVVIADIDGSKATRFADSLGSKARAMEVDVRSDQSLASALQACDIVVSTVGPYYLFGPRVLSAAINAGVHYIDICDDPEPTLDTLALDDRARAAGITAIIGAGASPGTSNLLAAKAMKLLPKATEIYTFWGTGGPLGDDEGAELGTSAAGPAAATLHWAQQISGRVKVYRNGDVCEIEPLQAIKLEFPGRAADRCHILGHPEPITLPRTYPDIKQSYNLMNMPGYVVYALKKAAAMVVKGDQKSIYDASVELTRMLSDNGQGLWDIAQYLAHGAKDTIRSFLPSLGAVARGAGRYGKASLVGVHLRGRHRVDDMAHATCIPTAIILGMMLGGKIQRRGVMAPEACVDPDDFFLRLAEHMHIEKGFDKSNYVECVLRHTRQTYRPL